MESELIAMPEMAFDQVPWWRVVVYLALSTMVLGNISTTLRRRLGWADGYSRKLNHVGIMLITIPLLAFLPDEQLLPAVFVGSVGLVVIYAIAALSSRPLVFGIVSGSLRQRDAPYSRFFFFLPLITFNVTLSLSTLFFPMDVVRVAFFTVAIADGLAEPVGLRFGQGNTYHIKDLVWGRINTKSVAGSSVVFAAAFAISLAMLAMRPDYSLGHAVMISASYATATTTLEALSPRGLDNMILAIACPAVLLSLMGLMI